VKPVAMVVVPLRIPPRTADTDLNRPARSLVSDAWRRFRRDRNAMLGLAMLTVIAVLVIVGPLVYTRPVDDIDIAQKLRPPDFLHLMGTDNVGRDVLARVLSGGRVTLAVGVISAAIALIVGTAIGACAGYFGGHVDTLAMRATELFLSLPTLPLLLLVIFVAREPLRQSIGPELGVFTLMVTVIGGLRWMPVARLVRATFLGIKSLDYMLACRSVGVPWHRQILRHMLPNTIGPIVVATTIGVAAAILAESTLSFLGLGFPPDMPTWGRLLLDSKDRLDSAPYLTLFPGLMVFLTVLSINFIGDGLDEAFDPRRH
jgi:peptide/nickel transport system permease protein